MTGSAKKCRLSCGRSTCLAKLLRQARGPLEKAMRIKASVEVTAPLHNSMMCLLLSEQSLKSECEAARSQGANKPPGRD
jgi:hypothetical protein